MSKKSGFTLIELMIVVAIIAIIAAIAIPNLLRSRMSANEAAAAGAMRTISTGEVGFQTAAFEDADGDGVGDYGTLAQLADPDGADATPPFIDDVLGAGAKQGYNFAVAVVAGGAAVLPAYTCTATPAAAGRTGFRQYFVDASGVIRFTADGTAVTVASAPLN
ncbi:MAG: prepilin-type N-terminal cleavage/methylation domain-containing protein [FCB group bacterium]|jgi:prepilin-type N-terminal cleavage/methylation domain-containing protein|nr:prepilin-type N-terminal cleavage/methylation domain-containing protein [FCB group bacterium]